MALLPSATDIFQLDRFTVDPSRNLISSGGEETSVEPKVMEVLCFLTANAGQVVSRAAIIDAVWGVAFGGDESLTRAISRLRKALQQAPHEPEIIQTISKRGYVLTAQPRPARDMATMPEPETPLIRPQHARKSWQIALVTFGLIVAMLAALFMFWPQPPVSNIDGIIVLVKPISASQNPPDSDALADALTASLGRFDQIKVRRFQPGQKVDTKTAYVYVVSGTLTSDGKGHRIGLQLQDYLSGNSLWSGSGSFIGGPDKAISALSAELQPAILQAAKTEVQKKPATSLSPWELILLGTWVPGADREWQGPPTQQSYWIWERAIEKDPGFALAHASLAQVMANFALFDPPSDTPEHAIRAEKSAERAVMLAPYDAGVLFQNALYYKYAGKRAEASAALRRVLDLEPDNIMARIELEYVTGQCSADSAGAIQRLKALDTSLPPASPAHWVIQSHMADMSLSRGDYAQARKQAASSRQIVRQVWSSITLAAADAELGDNEQAAIVGSEHKGQWPALDYVRFADGNLSRWCLGGDTTHARDAFIKLGRIIASKQP